MKTIRFTKKELKWIERTADIESARAMERFLLIVNKTNIKKLSKKEQDTLISYSNELIDLYTFLKELRTKFDLWDCRYDIDKELEVKDG